METPYPDFPRQKVEKSIWKFFWKFFENFFWKKKFDKKIFAFPLEFQNYVYIVDFELSSSFLWYLEKKFLR